MSKTNVYNAIIEAIFQEHYRQGESSFTFERREITDTARTCGVEVPKNLGDLIYSFRITSGKGRRERKE